jgi:hypothetical protein
MKLLLTLLCHLKGRKSNSIVEGMADTKQTNVRRHRTEKQLAELLVAAANKQVLCGADTAGLVIRLEPVKYRRSAVHLSYYMDSSSSLLTPCLYAPLRTSTSFTTDVHTSTLLALCLYTFTLGSRNPFARTSSHLKWAIANSSHLPSLFKQLSSVT